MGVNQEPTREVLLLGATGLVGGHALRYLEPRTDLNLHAPVRRLPTRAASPALFPFEGLADPSALNGLRTVLEERLHGRPLWGFVCCLGTTIKDAGSKEAFIGVDRDLIVRMASLAKELGATRAVVVSSVGADRASSQFYLRVKGETEDALEGLGFESLVLVRPGLLIGPRRASRPFEGLAQKVQPWFDVGLRGKWRKYRSVRAEQVADALVRGLSDESLSGVSYWEYEQIVGDRHVA